MPKSYFNSKTIRGIFVTLLISLFAVFGLEPPENIEQIATALVLIVSSAYSAWARSVAVQPLIFKK